MDLIRVLLSRCAALLRRRRLDADLDEELCAHIELAARRKSSTAACRPQKPGTAALRASLAA